MTAKVWSCVLACALAACGTEGPDGDGDGEGSGDGDGDGDGDASDGTLIPPPRGFQIVTPTVTLPAHTETTYCYYFKTPNTETFSIKKWTSEMSSGSHHLILYFTPQLGMPEGTMTNENCSIFSGGISNLPSWVYSAQISPQALELPGDDGAGNPIGMDVPPGQAAYLELHYNNTNDTPLDIKASINADAYDAGITTTKTYAYVTYDSDISIESGKPETETLDSNIPATSKVWLMSTHTHKHATATEVKNGSEVLFASTDWQHPGAKEWKTAPFYSFSTGKLTVTCSYYQNSGSVIVDGESADKNEMCMASGYVFPATKATICFNGFVF